jgi:hypothetical protein
MRRARSHGVVVGLVLLVLLSACTDGAPSVVQAPPAAPPTPAPATPIGARVGVVLPPTSELDASMLASMHAQLGQRSQPTHETVRELRGYDAADPRFVEDVARWLAEQDTELVCVLGDRAEDVAVTLAALYGGVRFCALPAGPPEPDEAGATPDGDEVARVDLRAEELGHLIGVTARIQADGDTVGLVLGGGGLPDDRFREGLMAGAAGAVVVEAQVPDGQDATLVERADAVIAAGAQVVVVDGGIGASEAVEVVGDRAVVIAPDSVLGDAADAQVALRWSVRWDRALDGPLHLLAGGAITPRHTSVGLEDDVFEVVLGAGASSGVGTLLEQTIEGLTDGTLDPVVPSTADPELEPASGAGSSDPSPAEPEPVAP